MRPSEILDTCGRYGGAFSAGLLKTLEEHSNGGFGEAFVGAPFGSLGMLGFLAPMLPVDVLPQGSVF
jgi:hypothetical protein